jgi:hypothetical protein
MPWQTRRKILFLFSWNRLLYIQLTSVDEVFLSANVLDSDDRQKADGVDFQGKFSEAFFYLDYVQATGEGFPADFHPFFCDT